MATSSRRMGTLPPVHPNVWRFIGFVSSLVGFICYATSPPFNKLYECGELGLLAIIIYCALGSLVCCTVLCATPRRLTKNSVLKAHVAFFVLMGTSVYSFYLDKSEEGKEKKATGKVLNLIATGAFALTSLSLSRLTDLGFEVGMFNFFLGFIMTSAMKMSGKFALAAAAFCYILISIRTCSDSQREGTRSSDAEQALTENLGSSQDLNNQGTLSSFNNLGAIPISFASANFYSGRALGGRQYRTSHRTSSSLSSDGGAQDLGSATINSSLNLGGPRDLNNQGTSSIKQAS